MTGGKKREKIITHPLLVICYAVIFTLALPFRTLLLLAVVAAEETQNHV